ncbi:MAG: hypothetical protein KAS12_00165 [Candidatus Aenigmarchaeota archaeon]|nr:hypothetical protein [Candidatus Aenigmarchaeota archaeon]
MSFEKESINQSIVPKRLDYDKAEKKIKEIIDFELLEKRIKTPFLLKKETKWLVDENGDLDFKEEREGVSAVIKALARLVLELKKTMTDYDTILSDDIHGRPVSLLLKKIIDKQRKRIGKKEIPIYFLASGRHRSMEQESEMEKFIVSKKEGLGKVLLVTELISTGRSMAHLTDILIRHDIDFEIAAAQINTRLKNDYDQILLERLRYGVAGGLAGSLLYHGTGLGVRKDNYSILPYPVLSDEDRGPATQLRQDIDVLANELSKLLD